MNDVKKRIFKCAKGRERAVTVCSVKGRERGPTLALVAGQHGMEHIGPIMLAELIDEIDPGSFRGELLVCPCANPFALELDYEFYPEREDLASLDNHFYSIARHDYCAFGMERQKGPNYYNMNRLWKIEEGRGVAGEIVKWLWESVCRPADVVIDFHCLQAEKPLIYSFCDQSNELASFYGVEAIFMHPVDPASFEGGNLGCQLHNDGRRLGFCVEFSKQHGLKMAELAIGKRGVLNIMKAIGMMDGEIVLDRPVWLVTEGHDFKARHTGHIHYRFAEYDPVKKGDIVYEIRSLETLETLDQALSPVDGVMGRRTWRAISVPGESVCQLYEVAKLHDAGSIVPDEFLGRKIVAS